MESTPVILTELVTHAVSTVFSIMMTVYVHGILTYIVIYSYSLKKGHLSQIFKRGSYIYIYICSPEEGCFTNPESASEYILELFIFFFLIYSLL